VDTEILNSGPTLADILTQKEVAALTRIPLSTLRYYRHIGSKGPRSFLLGNRVVYWRSDLLDWIEQQYNAEGERTGAA
jgi:DNA-binding transcriptional MerR regulator